MLVYLHLLIVIIRLHVYDYSLSVWMCGESEPDIEIINSKANPNHWPNWID